MKNHSEDKLDIAHVESITLDGIKFIKAKVEKNDEAFVCQYCGNPVRIRKKDEPF